MKDKTANYKKRIKLRMYIHDAPKLSMDIYLLVGNGEVAEAQKLLYDIFEEVRREKSNS